MADIIYLFGTEYGGQPSENQLL